MVDIVLRPFEGITVASEELLFGASKEEAETFRDRFNLTLEYDEGGGVSMMMLLNPIQYTPVLNGHRIEERTMREAAAGLVACGFQASLRPPVIPGTDLTAPYEALTTFAQLEWAYREWEAMYCPSSTYFDDVGVLLWSELGTEDDDTEYNEPVLNMVALWAKHVWDNPETQSLFKGRLALS